MAIQALQVHAPSSFNLSRVAFPLPERSGHRCCSAQPSAQRRAPELTTPDARAHPGGGASAGRAVAADADARVAPGRGPGSGGAFLLRGAKRPPPPSWPARAPSAAPHHRSGSGPAPGRQRRGPSHAALGRRGAARRRRFSANCRTRQRCWPRCGGGRGGWAPSHGAFSRPSRMSRERERVRPGTCRMQVAFFRVLHNSPAPACATPTQSTPPRAQPPTNIPPPPLTHTATARRPEAPPRVGAGPHRAMGSTAQISRAYLRMVSSEEKRAMPAQHSIDMRVHSSCVR